MFFVHNGIWELDWVDILMTGHDSKGCHGVLCNFLDGGNGAIIILKL